MDVDGCPLQALYTNSALLASHADLEGYTQRISGGDKTPFRTQQPITTRCLRILKPFNTERQNDCVIGKRTRLLLHFLHSKNGCGIGSNGPYSVSYVSSYGGCSAFQNR
ncbi:hypothetical protein POM88_050715 [Heracleum sosnowskyi]|uniref:Uncharacterized protein n=1 Tax=Heracleum sosnowskyi TaxID=360622 RepID=A0AAD8GZ74_9APIA|nr:hypothetical protein POM88_050715 [Heracleum sosnowskyi]